MDADSFYAVTLSEAERLSQFEVAESDNYLDHKLIIKQICLGVDAKDGEFNVVQAETRVSEKETLKIPIAVLKVGETRVLRPNVEFPGSSVTFKLIQGSGPVYISGQQVVREQPIIRWGDGEEMGEEEEFSEDDVPIEITNGKNTNKKK